MKFLRKLSKVQMIAAVLLVVIVLAKWFFGRTREFFGNGQPLRGYYKWTWSPTQVPAGSWDMGILFGGESPRQAIDININKASTITSGKKFLNLGGGLESGIWNVSDLDYINQKLTEIKRAGWDGLCFDVEVCTPNVSFVDAFKNCFAKCKQAGLKVLVTMSHTNPYQCQTGAGQGMDLVNSWINDSNVDYISPQLYSSGDSLEPSNLSMFKSVENKIVPSIPDVPDWDGLNTKTGINNAGYIIWKQIGDAPPNSNRCGPKVNGWSAASSCTTKKCPGGTDGECGDGMMCFANTGCPA